MNLDRAQEIIRMEQTIDVKLDGVPVWIDSVDSSTNSAMVHVKNQPSNKKTVSVAELKEV